MSTYHEPPRYDADRRARFPADRQGELSDQERADRALTNFIKDTDFTTATYLEGCIHCGLCAEACHFYEVTGNPVYTPVWKLEPFKKAYKREASPFSFIYKALNLKSKLTASDLEDWQHLIYDSCTICGRCSMICPMGIDIASLILKARHAMYDAGIVSQELWEMSQKQEQEGSPMGVSKDKLMETIEQLRSEQGIDIPVDQTDVDIMVTASSAEILKYPETLADMARVIEHMGYSWTLRTDGYEASNYGMLAGNERGQNSMSRQLIDAAIASKARMVIVPECGHAYGALRWEAAELYGQPLPFEVLHMTELMANEIEKGNLKVSSAQESITFHDPCQVSRRGGATDAPRKVMQALGVDLHEMPVSGDLSWCCGGGGGVYSIERAKELRYKSFEIKMDQVEDSGADKLYTSCSDCRMNFDDGSEHFNWDKETNSLLSLVASNLA
jgi:Fe-S oxidoreductase